MARDVRDALRGGGHGDTDALGRPDDEGVIRLCYDGHVRIRETDDSARRPKGGHEKGSPYEQ